MWHWYFLHVSFVAIIAYVKHYKTLLYCNTVTATSTSFLYKLIAYHYFGHQRFTIYNTRDDFNWSIYKFQSRKQQYYIKKKGYRVSFHATKSHTKLRNITFITVLPRNVTVGLQHGFELLPHFKFGTAPCNILISPFCCVYIS